jgi:hypothetical protein
MRKQPVLRFKLALDRRANRGEGVPSPADGLPCADAKPNPLACCWCSPESVMARGPALPEVPASLYQLVMYCSKEARPLSVSERV